METKKVVKNSIYVFLITLISKPLGLIREMMIAAYFGVSVEMDAFFMAQSMPGMIFPSVCLAISTAFMPQLIGVYKEKQEKEADSYIARMNKSAFYLAVILSLMAIAGSSFLVRLLAPGFDEETIAICSGLTRVVMISFPITMMQYMLNSYLESKGAFGRSQIGNIIYNVIIISCAFLFKDSYGTYGLAVTYIIAQLGYTAVLIVSCTRKYHLPMIKPGFTGDFGKLIRLALPIMIGNSVFQINQIVDKNIASNFVQGSISGLSYASTLNLFVYSIFVTSVTIVLFPTFTDAYINKGKEQFSNDIKNSIFCLSAILIPLSFITMIFSKDIVTVVYGRGEFSAEDIQLTAGLLKVYAAGFLFNGVRELFVKALYAASEQKQTFINSCISVLINVTLSIMLSKVYGVIGIALATSISTGVSVLILFMTSRRILKLRLIAEDVKELLKLLLAGSLCMLILFALERSLSMNSLLRFVISSLTGGICYLIMLVILKSRLILWIKRLIRK